MKTPHKNTRIINYGLTLLALVALCVCLTGCGDDEEDAPPMFPNAWMPI